ncbi:MAG: methyl-accepting chemotaxis protein [Deltaproteobacteria bacterium]|nr:methyl-accepting chemotaxis protein [Deltaproteobacteria bacterium]
MKKKTLGFKLVAGGIVAVMIPLLVVGIFAAVKASNSLETAAKERVMGGAAKLASLVQEVLSAELKIATEIALSAGDAGTMDKRLAEAMAKIGKDYEVIMVTDASGVVVADSNNGQYKGVSFGDREYFRKARDGKANVGAVNKSKKTGTPVTTACAPIMKDGNFAGAVIQGIKLDALSDKVAEKMGETGFGFMIDSKGLLLAHPKKDFILELDMTKQAGMEAIAAKMLAKKAGAESYVFKGVSKIAGFAPVELTGWSIAITQDTDEFLAAAHSIRNFIAVIGLIFLVLTAVCVAWFARSISTPIRNAVDQMSEAANQVAAASSQVSGASQTLAEGASEQASAIEETSSSLEEMSSMTKQNAGSAGQADGLMKQTNLVIQKANEGMQSLTQSMTEITAASEETSKIIKTIDEIAFQTNLLALNAAVEAARAGEAGAGFAVVAEEVRNLAIRAAEAAKNTSGLIEGTVGKIKAGSALVVKTNEAFAEVSTNASKVGELVGEISAASQEQSQGIDQINKAVAEMDKVTQSTAATAEESASASEEMNAQAEQMKQVAITLVSIIGGDGHDGRSIGRESLPAKKSLAQAIPAVTAGKSAGRDALTPRKSPGSRPERLIPMGEGQFKDF